MNKYKITIEYDGADFVGWQKQDNGISIQSSIEEAIEKLLSEKVILFGAGRTDSGVHAKGQVAHFETSKDFSVDKIRDGLNQYLKNKSIAILKAEQVDNKFDARFSAKLRYYEYKIINRRAPLTIEKKLAWSVFKKLNIIDMQKAAKLFIGKNDLSAFRSIDCQSLNSTKTIRDFDISTFEDNIFINVSAKSFLHSQVRIMVGTLVEIGKGKITNSIKKIIKDKNRSQAGITAPACGLYLIKVEY